MKRFLVLILVFIFLLICSANTLAQATASRDQFATTPDNWYSNTDTWYSITPEKSYLDIYYGSINTNPSTSSLGLEYYKHDHTFFDVISNNVNNSSYNGIAGSYLFGDSGFFIGALHQEFPNHGYTLTNTMLSPGVRLSQDGGPSYFAFSYDYLIQTYRGSTVSDVYGYDFRFKRYKEDKYKIFGDFYLPKVEGIDGTMDLGINFKTFENLVCGLEAKNVDGTTYYIVGLTLSPYIFIGDARYMTNSDQNRNEYKVSGMFKLGENFKIGAEYYKQSLYKDGKTTFKAQFTSNKSNFNVKYTQENDYFYSELVAAYEMVF